MELKRFFAVLILLFSFALFPCGNAHYTMGPGIDFPMIMSYKDTENPNFEPYFYFLNGHNDLIYFSNSSFDDFESYEYNPWGVLLTSANKNNLNIETVICRFAYKQMEK